MHTKFLQLGIPLCISNSVVPSLPICFNSNVHNQKIYEICPDRGCSHVFVFRCLTEMVRVAGSAPAISSSRTRRVKLNYATP